MAGNAALPFRPLPAGSNAPAAAAAHYSACDIVERWENITKTRPAGDSGGAHYTASPVPREDEAYAISVGDPTTPAGVAGKWYIRGLFNGVSERVVEITVPDLTTCAAAPVVTSDSNCYQRNGNLDLRNCKKVGAKWVICRQPWHGAKGLVDAGDPNPISAIVFDAGDSAMGALGFNGYTTTFNETAPQVKYLAKSLRVSGSTGYIDAGGTLQMTPSYYNADSSVGRYTGIESRTGSHLDAVFPGGSTPFTDRSASVFTLLNGINYSTALSALANFSIYPWSGAGVYSVTSSGGVYTYRLTTPRFVGYETHLAVEIVASITSSGMSISRTVYDEYLLDSGTMTGTWFVRQQESITIANNRGTYSLTYTEPYTLPMASVETLLTTNVITATLDYSAAYTSADLCKDLHDLAASWNLKDDPFRTDEQWANAPMTQYDGVRNAVSPTLDYVATMDDYTGTISGTWPQRAWIDPNISYGITTATPSRNRAASRAAR
jgi:hypothetical protein